MFSYRVESDLKEFTGEEKQQGSNSKRGHGWSRIREIKTDYERRQNLFSRCSIVGVGPGGRGRGPETLRWGVLSKIILA